MTTPLTLPATFLYSDAVSPYESSPQTRPSSGQGGPGRLSQVSGIAQVTSNLATTAGVRLVRIPTNAVVKTVKVGIEHHALTFTSMLATLGLVFSDNQYDGTTPANQSLVYSCGAFAATTGAGFDFSSVALDVTLDVTYKAQLGVQTFTDGYYTMSASHLPIWNAIASGGLGGLGAASAGPADGLLTDPGGFFDVYLQPTTQFNVSGNFWMHCEVTYVGY